MATLLESKLTPAQHASMKKLLVAQTNSFGALEMPIVADLLKKHGSRSVLDIGCGEGSFLLRLAKETRGIRYVGIDHSEPIIKDARGKLRRQSVRNVTFKAAFFDRGFEQTKYDAAMTRYTLQHSSAPQVFLDAVYQRLERKGTFIAMESLDAYTDCHEPDPIWDRFKTSIAAIHQKVGSNADIGKSLGRLLKDAGFQRVQVWVLLCSPSTVGWKRFQSVVRGSAELAWAFFPDLFDRQLLEEVVQWLGDRSIIEQKDPYLCSTVAHAVKP